ncbi:MAG: alcohol dehydrogenase catalytic domain-containing protein [Spirochaetota bacterium]
MKAKTLWYTGPRTLELKPVDIPEPGPGEALVEVSVCGVCTWDLFIYSGGFQDQKAFPFAFGHEGIGRVVRSGPGVDLAEGQRVALRESGEIGKPGSAHMAEYALQKADSLVALPEDDVPDHLFMIEPTACCVNALNITPVRPADRVALVGAGYMGGILLQLLAMGPAREIVVFERRPEAIDYASSLASDTPIRVVDTTELPASGSWADQEGLFDLVVETTGVEPGFRLADSLVRNGGRFVIFSWQHHPFVFDFGSWHQRGILVSNSSPAASWDFTGCFEQARELIHAGRVDQSDLVTHVSTPEDAKALYEHGLAKDDGYIKGVIRWR